MAIYEGRIFVLNCIPPGHKGNMRTIVAGNWKMHKDRREAADLMTALVGGSQAWSPLVEVMVAPPFPFLADAVEHARGARLVVAAQNCHEAAHGAFTGEVSVSMLGSIGVGACIVGHSERRQYYGETDTAVGRKIAALLKANIAPIYCCGEVLEEREQGRHFEVVARQMDEAFRELGPMAIARTIIAYEPVWAIGTGRTASPDQAQEMHAFIRARLVQRIGDAGHEVPLLYGGSCKPDNAGGLFGKPDINGGLIGGAALDAAQFNALITIAGTVTKR
jgi:triosephosphate isomerase